MQREFDLNHKYDFRPKLHDFKRFPLVIIPVSFCDLGTELATQDSVRFGRRHLIEDIFKMVRLAPTSKDFRLYTVF